MLSRQRHFALGASLLLHYLNPASAVCTNFTYLGEALDVLDGDTKQYQQKLDFISCPSSLNHSCQITPRDYNITIPILLNITTNQTFEYRNLIEDIASNSYAFNQSSDVPDVKSIWANPPNAGDVGIQTAQEPQAITVNPLNVSTLPAREPGSVNLTVESGYNATLFYNPFMAWTFATFSGCDNASLDGILMEIVAPYFHPGDWGIQPEPNNTVLAGIFYVATAWLNDSVTTSSKKNAGVAMRIEKVSIAAMMGFGVMSLMML
jgi:hypothetical protein